MIRSFDDMYLYEIKKQFFILDPNSQMFWFVKDRDYESLLLTVEQLKKYGFFKQKVDFETENKELREDIKHIVINPTFKCNLDCWYCYSIDFHHKNFKEMSFNDIQRTITFFADYKYKLNSTAPLAISMFFTSDITLDFPLFKEVERFVKKIKNKYNFDFYLFPASTNLVSVSDEFVNFINEYGYVNVSLDFENQEQIETVLRNILRFESTVVKHCIIPLNSRMNDLFKIYIKYMKSFDFVSMRPVRVSPNSKIPWTENSIYNFKKELKKLIEEILSLKDEELIKFLNKLGSSDYLAKFIDRIISRKRYHSRCLAGKNEIVISSDKNFYPCSGLIGNKKYKMGSLSEGLFPLKNNDHHILNNIYNSICRSCSIRFYCGGPCLDWLEMQHLEDMESTNIFECTINLIYFELCSFLIFRISQNFPVLIEDYSKKKGIENRISYPLSFTDFVLFFS